MDQPRDPFQSLVDIEPPLPPPEPAWPMVIAGAGMTVVLALAAVLVWRWYRSPRVRARRRLKALQRAYQHAHVDPRTTAFWVAAILRDGLGLQRLSGRRPREALDGDAGKRWRQFLERLEKGRFTRDGCSPGEVATLVREAHDWLRQHP